MEAFGSPSDAGASSDNYSAGAGGKPLQVAALPYRVHPAGCDVMLVTSRRSGRWILPKGWPYHGASLVKSAAREAYEEAGIQGTIGRDEVGRFITAKVPTDGGEAVSFTVIVYPLRVETEHENWPERDERQRQWFPLSEARNIIAVEQRQILEAFNASS
jgi:8-oxo-dGTP pyrophosphatase MutT (NUDIX family)